MILDDALSSVDTDTEDKILSLLRVEIEQRTSILISHRISTIQNADKIIVLDKGKIAETGTHSRLLKAGGLYAEMYRKQLIVEELDRSL